MCLRKSQSSHLVLHFLQVRSLRHSYFLFIQLNSFVAEFVKAILSKDGSRLPQAIAHRGYKAMFPENTMAAFTGAVKVGAHALETDIHLTKDGIVVLSHVSMGELSETVRRAHIAVGRQS
jgi:glycerophosphoryl diester phosphodiesterase